MIKGVHAMFYSGQAEELRAFLRDKLQLPCTDVGGGWLVFDFAQADLGVHPTGFPGSPPSGTHDVSFFCDDIEATVAELRARGVEFKDGIGLRLHHPLRDARRGGGGALPAPLPQVGRAYSRRDTESGGGAGDPAAPPV